MNIGIYDINTLKIALLIHQRSPITSIFGPREMFSMAASTSSAIDMQFDFVSAQKGSFSLKSGAQIEVHSDFSDDTRYDLILVAALGHPSQTDLSGYSESIAWLQKHAKQNTHIASICSGAFLLAEASLLEQKRATTHWITADHFRARYPNVLLDIDQMVCRDGNMWSSGGAYAFQDLCLSLIQHYCGQDIAQYCANVLMLEPPGRTQNRFATLHLYKLHTDEKVSAIQAYIEKAFQTDIDNSDLSKYSHLSERQVIRRFKQATGISPNLYIQKVRIEAAKKLLRDEAIPISLLANEIGYSDTGYFRTLFKRLSGQTPTEYRRNFGVKK